MVGTQLSQTEVSAHIKPYLRYDLILAEFELLQPLQTMDGVNQFKSILQYVVRDVKFADFLQTYYTSLQGCVSDLVARNIEVPDL